LQPTEKIDWIPEQQSQMRQESPQLRAFAASRDPRSKLQVVARSHEAENLRPFGIYPHAMEIGASQSSCSFQVTEWDFCDAGNRLRMSRGNLR
jgi:hypothetical protein